MTPKGVMVGAMAIGWRPGPQPCTHGGWLVGRWWKQGGKGESTDDRPGTRWCKLVKSKFQLLGGCKRKSKTRKFQKWRGGGKEKALQAGLAIWPGLGRDGNYFQDLEGNGKDGKEKNLKRREEMKRREEKRCLSEKNERAK